MLGAVETAVGLAEEGDQLALGRGHAHAAGRNGDAAPGIVFLVRQIELAARDKGEHIAILEARKQYAWYLKGVPHAGYYKEQIVRMNTLEDMYRITEGIRRDLI